MSLNRRQVLKTLAATPVAAAAGLPGLSFATTSGDARLVVVLLRGGMDGLTVVPPVGDPDHERARRGIAVAEALPLDDTFGLHPALPELHSLFARQELLIVHAAASPYRARSHFDAQHLLENGTATPYGADSGWLNRALIDVAAGGDDAGVSITANMPVIMRGDAPVTSWSPSTLPDPDQDTIARVTRLYAGDEAFAQTFAKARTAQATMGMTGRRRGQFPALMEAAGRFLASSNGPRVAFVELGGWDTHAGQASEFGPLRRNLQALDAGVMSLHNALGKQWAHTAVVAVTEFGRTVAMNGSNGTDHGTASCALLTGGAVRGGRVLADWPGLKAAQLQEGRDLKPTIDLRAVFKSLLLEHLAVSEAHLENAVFPDSSHIAPLDDLLLPRQSLS